MTGAQASSPAEPEQSWLERPRPRLPKLSNRDGCAPVGSSVPLLWSVAQL